MEVVWVDGLFARTLALSIELGLVIIKPKNGFVVRIGSA